MVTIETLRDGIRKITLSVGEYSVSVLTLGAILQSWKLGDHDVVLGYDDPKDYDHCPTYFGEVVGPYANRIANGEFYMDGCIYHLERNNGPNSLHSGSKNFGDEIFEIVGRSECSVTLALLSPEKGGFPGSHEVMVTYYLSEQGELTLDYSVTSTEKCPVNVTNHAYFNPDGDGDIRSVRLQIPAENYIAVDDTLIPTGVVPTEGTDFDFRKMREIGEKREGKYDNCFVLPENAVVIAEGKEYRISMRTTMPGVQLYTGEFISGPAVGKNGMSIGPFKGFALETEYWPDFPNHKEFEGDWTLPGKVWRATTTYKLERK